MTINIKDTNIKDTSEEPRSERELTDAKKAIIGSIVRDSPSPIMVYYPTIIDAIIELIEARKAITELGSIVDDT